MPSTESVSQAVELTQLQRKGLIRKPVIHSPSMEDPQRIIAWTGRATSLGRSAQNAASMDDLTHHDLESSLGYPEKENPMGKAPSNVRKMRSAYESGLVQDTRSHIKPPPTKCQFSEIEINAPSTYQHSKDDKAQDTEVAGFLKGRIRGASHAGELQQAPVCSRESREHFKLEELSTITILNKQTETIARNKCEDKFYFVESSGAWIFPDEQKKFCLQTDGKILMDLLESRVKRISHQRSLDFSILEVADKDATSFGAGAEVSIHGRIHKFEESKSKNSNDNDDQNSGGPVKQVIKVAIIVGFGILVLLTRQSKSR